MLMRDSAAMDRVVRGGPGSARTRTGNHVLGCQIPVSGAKSVLMPPLLISTVAGPPKPEVKTDLDVRSGIGVDVLDCDPVHA